MAALESRLRPVGEIPQHRQAGLPLQQRGQAAVQPRGAVVEEQPGDLAGLPEAEHPLDLGGQGQAGPLGPQDQQHRQPQGAGCLPGAGPVRAAHPVVKAHGPFAHRRPVARGIPGIERPQPPFPAEEQVQVVALHPQHRPVEHGVDVVRPALEGQGDRPRLGQRRQQGAGHGGLSAARGHGPCHKLNHHNSPRSKTLDCGPAAGAGLPLPAPG